MTARPQHEAVAHRVMIVEDHPMMRRAITAVLQQESDLTVCGEAADTAAAIDLARRTQPDLAIIDLRLDGGHGLELISQLVAQDPELACLVYSTLDESLYGERAIHAGAMGFLNKRAPAAQILEAVRTVLAGHVYLSLNVASRMLRRPHAKEEKTPASAVDTLSDREIQVLELIGEGKSIHQIADQLMISPKTVDSHRQRIKRKLEVTDNAGLMRVAVEWAVAR